jgi:hypothetical protein
MTTFPQLPAWRRWVLRHAPTPLLREPFALWIALACFLASAGQLAGLDEPGTINRLLPRWMVLTWNVELLIGGLLTLVGIAADRVRLLVFGLTPLGFGCLAYSAAIIAVAGGRGMFAALLTSFLGLSCLVKSFVYTTAGFHVIVGNKDDGC